MDGDFEAVALSLQFASAGLLVVVMTLVHVLGLATITPILRLEGERLEEHDFDCKAIALMCGMALLLFALHLVARPHRGIFPRRLAAARLARSDHGLPADRLVDGVHRQPGQQAEEVTRGAGGGSVIPAKAGIPGQEVSMLDEARPARAPHLFSLGSRPSALG